MIYIEVTFCNKIYNISCNISDKPEILKIVNDLDNRAGDMKRKLNIIDDNSDLLLLLLIAIDSEHNKKQSSKKLHNLEKDLYKFDNSDKKQDFDILNIISNSVSDLSVRLEDINNDINSSIEKLKSLISQNTIHEIED